jgi:hypothetical protein
VRRPFDWLAAAHLLLQSVIVLQKFRQTKKALNVICFRLGKDSLHYLVACSPSRAAHSLAIRHDPRGQV